MLANTMATDNHTHSIGLRDAYDWFPNEIYYSATLQQQKDYNTKFSSK